MYFVSEEIDKFTMRGIIYFIFVMIGVHTGRALDMYDDMTRLMEDEFRDYHKDVIPKRKTTDSHVTVKVYPKIKRIESLDEDLQELSTTISLTMNWVDDRLAWDPRMYNGVREIHVPATKIWMPDISVTNSVYPADEHNHPATCSYQGRINLIRIVHAQTPCIMDYTSFPNDEHSCAINITSWKYTGQDLVIDMWNDVTDLQVETDSSVWTTTGKVRVMLEVMPMACCPDDDFPQLSITLTVRRISNMLHYILVLPMMLVSLLVPVQFLVPNQRENRHLFGILLVICGFLSFINMCLHVSFTASLPFIGIMHIVCISFASLGVVLSTIATNIGSKYSSLNQSFIKHIICSKCCVKDRSRGSERYEMRNSNVDNKETQPSNGETQHMVDTGETEHGSDTTRQCTNHANYLDLVFFIFFIVCFIVEICVLFIHT